MTFTSHASGDFWRHYHSLPEEIRKAADKQYELFETNPSHLRLKPVGPFGLCE